jgi:hypothetical protein
VVKAEMAKTGNTSAYVEYMRARAEAFVAEINEFMQGERVLCVTTQKGSERMWCEYAENHKGIVLRIEPNIAKDSKFQLFRPVIYREKRPSLYDDTLEFIAGSLFGNLRLAARRCTKRSSTQRRHAGSTKPNTACPSRRSRVKRHGTRSGTILKK